VRDTKTPGQPGWYFVRLLAKLQANQSRISRLKAYLTGDAPLPEMDPELKDAYRAFQKKSRTNWGEIIVESTAERMTPAGCRIGGTGLEGDRADELVKDAALIWSVNELDVVADDVHSDMLAFGEGYVMVGGPDSDGISVITREDPEHMAAERDPLRPNKVRAALKAYHDDESGKDVAYLYLPGLVLRAEKRNDGTAASSGYEWTGGDRLPLRDAMPVVHFRNRRGMGEFEANTDVIDRIIHMVLQRLIIVSMQAFRQRAILGDLPEMAEKLDENGHPVLDEDGAPVLEAIDYGELWRPGAGNLWTGMVENTKIWESQVTDITQILNAVKDDLRDLAAVTRTPMSMLLPDGQNQTAEGAQFAREALVFKAADRIKRAGASWNQVTALALRFAGKADKVLDVETLWKSHDRLTLAERADATQKLSNLIPFKTLMTEVMGFSAEQAEKMEQERIDDLVNALIQTSNNTDTNTTQTNGV